MGNRTRDTGSIETIGGKTYLCPRSPLSSSLPSPGPEPWLWLELDPHQEPELEQDSVQPVGLSADHEAGRKAAWRSDTVVDHFDTVVDRSDTGVGRSGMAVAQLERVLERLGSKLLRACPSG